MYGDWTSGSDGDGTFVVEKEYAITENLRNNGSLYLYGYLTRLGESPDPKDKNYAKSQYSFVKKVLNR